MGYRHECFEVFLVGQGDPSIQSQKLKKYTINSIEKAYL